MKLASIIVACCLFGCAETRIYRDGKLACIIQADATNVTFRSGDIYFHADTLIHSKPTQAAYQGTAQTIGAAGSAAGLAARAILK